MAVIKRNFNSGRIAKEGYPFIFLGLVLVLVAWFVHFLVVLFFSAVTLFVVYFFRNPRRTIPEDPRVVVAPADGKVIFSGEASEQRYLKKVTAKVSIFMSPLNVHVNRIPMNGTVDQVHYNKGKYFAAFSDKASLDNEQNAVVLKNEQGETCVFVQIAGWLARRIVCYAKPGEVWAKGDIFGIIRFGSRMDIYLPPTYQLCIQMGQRVRAGETVIARQI